MIAVDTNLLVYEHRRESRAYKTAYKVLREGAGLGNTMAVLL